MNNEEIRKKEEIESTLAAMIGDDSLETSEALLAVLGYRSELTTELWETVEEFIERFPAENENTRTEQEFRDNAESVEIIFQVTSDEIASNQPALFGSRFDAGNTESFMFFVVELKGKDYPRGKYAQFTREINKRIDMPIVVFFRVENRLTIGFVGRRQHERDPDRDVLKRVTLIKDILLDKPHRAHIDILFELSLEECAKWMDTHNQPENFDGLLAAWLARLDTSELNKRFFNELANWYFWAVDQVTFPEDAEEDDEVRNATSVIRLLTRLIFVWFIKEKGLVPNALFNRANLDDILENLDPQESTYYKAILQNLFFATLNQEMNTPQQPNNRKFRGERQQHYNITSLYRYKDYFIDPDDALRKFETIPFLNGGLFECLDAPSKEDATRILRVDSFSDRNDNPLHVPNELFFSDERTVDLNAAYGTRGRRYRVRGLIHILSSYKFTIAENTPIEEEVALDPELLGKVFENLLAAYNPETEVTARKQTGSYYTPREIVNYMTDESLVAYLRDELVGFSEAQRSFSVTTPPSQLNLAGQADPVQTELDVETVSLSDEQKAEIEQKLRELFVYNDEPNPFDKADTEVLIRAIDTLKILDPAVGSGAFPMGGLHKLVFILGKLDPGNVQWKDRQIDDSPDNRGVRPLPNLETKFVAANTLIGLDRLLQMQIRNPQIDRKEKELEDVRRRHFTARTPKTKAKYRALDAQIRAEISELLEGIGFPHETTEKIAHWDPYDQNASADFFDSEWMFNVRDGYDVVIGNPPYIQLQKDGGRLGRLYAPCNFDSFTRTGDIYCLFYERANQLLKAGGHACLITSNKWMRAAYGKKLRDYFIEHTQPVRLLDMGPDVFDATVDTNILLLQNAASDVRRAFTATTIKSNFDTHAGDIAQYLNDNGVTMELPSRGEPWAILSPAELALKCKIEETGKPLEDWDINIYRGITTGCNEAFIIDEAKRQELIARDPRSAKIIKPLLRGRDIKHYHPQWERLYLLFIPWHFPLHGDSTIMGASQRAEEQFRRRHPCIYRHLLQYQDKLSERNRSETGIRYEWYALQRCANTYYPEFGKEKIVWQEMTTKGTFLIDKNRFYSLDTTRILTGKNLRTCFKSHLIRFRIK